SVHRGFRRATATVQVPIRTPAIPWASVDWRCTSGRFQREHFKGCFSARMGARPAQMTTLLHAVLRTSEPGSSGGTCSDRFEDRGWTIAGKAGGATNRPIIVTFSYSLTILARLSQ